MLILQEKKMLGMSKALLEIMMFYFDNNRDTTSYVRSLEANLYLTILGEDGSESAITVHVLFKDCNWDNQLNKMDTVSMQEIIECLHTNYDLLQNLTIMYYGKD